MTNPIWTKTRNGCFEARIDGLNCVACYSAPVRGFDGGGAWSAVVAGRLVGFFSTDAAAREAVETAVPGFRR